MDLSVFHRHPALKWVVGGVGLVVFISLWRGGGSSSATTTSASGGTSDAVQIATIQANAQANSSGAALQAAHDQNQTQVQIASLAAGLQSQNSDNGLAATLAQIEASLSLGNHQLDTQYGIAQLSATTTQQANSLAASVQTHMTDSAASVQHDIISTNAATTGSLIDMVKSLFAPAPVTQVTQVVQPPPAPAQLASATDFLRSNPDIGQYWTTHQNKKDQAEYSKLGITDINSYVAYHISHFDDSARPNLPGTTLH